MKNTALLLRIVLLGLIILLPQISNAQETPDKIADSFYEHGQKMIRDGKYSDAISDFSRAFLLNPNDPKLHDALKSLSREKNVPASQKMDLILLEDLLEYTKKLKDKSDYFRYKRNVLGEDLMEKGFERSFFEQEMVAIDAEQKAVLDQEEAEIQERYAKGEDPLKVIHASLKLENKRLQNEIELFEKQYNRLREVNAKNGYIQGEVALLSPSEFSRKQRFYDEEGNRVPADVQAKTNLNTLPDVGGITSLLDEAKVKLDDMHLVLEDRDDKIDHLSKEIVDLSLELTESKSKETEKNGEINKLRSELVEFESKNLLTQRLEKNFKDLKSKLAQTETKLKDKEKQIKELDEKIQSLMAKGEGIEKKLEGRDQEIAEYQRQIKELKKESENMVKFKSEVDKLKEELSKAQKYQDEAWKLRYQVAQLKQNETKKKETDKELAKKDEIIKDQKAELAMKDKQIEEKDKSLKELNQQVLDFESRFELTQNIIKEKEEKLQKLEKELAQKDEIHAQQLAKKDKEITGLNKVLEEYREKLASSDKVLSEKDKRIAKLDSTVKGKLEKSKDDDRFYISKDEGPKISADREKELNSIIMEKERELKQVTNMITLYKQNLQDANQDIDYQKQQIDDLTKELARLDDKILTRDRLSREKINHIELLKDLLQQEKEKRDLRSDNLRVMVQKKVLEIQELEGMLEIYKLKLKDKHYDAQQKEEMMGEIQAQLDNTLVELYDKSKVIDKTHHNLVVLKDQLLEIHQRLSVLQNSSAEEQQNPAVKQEIQSLQTKIDDINAFLKGEIQTMEVSTPEMSEVDEDPGIENVVTSEAQLNKI
ncbi:MAG: hypothetical protein AB7S78_12815 [Candidatus Omnitrophota bacterium]